MKTESEAELPKVLIVDDIVANRNILNDALDPLGYNVLLASNGASALKVALRALPDVILLDVMMPKMDGYETCRQLKSNEKTRDIPVIFITARDEVTDMIDGFRVGAVDYISKPFQTEEVKVRVANHLRISQLAKQLKESNEALEAKNEKLEQEIQLRGRAEEALTVAVEREAQHWGVTGFVGESPAFKSVQEAIERLTKFRETSVLIIGESGTGKELIARSIHYSNKNIKGSFVAVNCSAIPSELAESTLFGHKRGSFTGAVSDQRGYFEQANNGTLFLDEIGDLPLLLQSKILRVLEDGVITPVGETKSKPVSARIIAATNAELESAVATKTFRKDLYFRLARYTIRSAPLRERREDIPLLVRHFLNKLASEIGMTVSIITDAAMKALMEYEFPGNIRELRNMIERALIDCGGDNIDLDHLRFSRIPVGRSAASTSDQTRDDPLVKSRSSDEERILSYVVKNDVISNAECRDLLGVKMHRAWYLLRKLNLAGKLTQDSSGRWATYRLVPVKTTAHLDRQGSVES